MYYLLCQPHHAVLRELDSPCVQSPKEALDVPGGGGKNEPSPDVCRHDVFHCQISVVNETNEVAHAPDVHTHVGTCGYIWVPIGTCGYMWVHVGTCG